MTLLALVLTLILEQFRPLNAARYLHPVLGSLARYFEDRFNDGQAHHGAIAWCLMVLPVVALVAIAYFFLYALHPLAALLFNIAVLYYTMGFRHSSHFFTRIHAALRAGELTQARKLLASWRGSSEEQHSTNEVVRLTIEQGVIGAHRQVFGVIIAFVLLPGPSGAVLYRMAEFAARHWAIQPEGSRFGDFSRRAFEVIEWLPSRLCAIAFSIVGDFEDAVYCWRTQAPQWPVQNEGVLIAAGAGALGVCVGGPVLQGGEPLERPDLGTGDEAQVEHLQSFVGLVRRTLVLYGLVLLMLSASRIAV